MIEMLIDLAEEKSSMRKKNLKQYQCVRVKHLAIFYI